MNSTVIDMKSELKSGLNTALFYLSIGVAIVGVAFLTPQILLGQSKGGGLALGRDGEPLVVHAAHGPRRCVHQEKTLTFVFL